MLHEQNENIDKDVEIIKRNQTETLELKVKITEMKNTLKEFKSICEQQEKESVNLKSGQWKYRA